MVHGVKKNVSWYDVFKLKTYQITSFDLKTFNIFKRTWFGKYFQINHYLEIFFQNTRLGQKLTLPLPDKELETQSFSHVKIFNLSNISMLLPYFQQDVHINPIQLPPIFI